MPDRPTRYALLIVLALGCATMQLPRAHAQSATRPQRPRTVAPAQNVDAPTMTDDYVTEPIAPLRAGWPVGASDAHLRGAACEVADTPLEARQKGDLADDVLPTLEQTSSVLPPWLLAVRRQPLVGRGDILVATYIRAKQGGYDIELRLDEDGAEKVRRYVAEHADGCFALVAGGKVVWRGGVGEPREDGTLVLPGGFPLSEADAIVALFARR